MTDWQRSSTLHCRAEERRRGCRADRNLDRVKDESYLPKRLELQHHHDIARYIKEEDLLRQPLKYGKLEPLGGFDRSIVIGS